MNRVSWPSVLSSPSVSVCTKPTSSFCPLAQRSFPPQLLQSLLSYHHLNLLPSSPDLLVSFSIPSSHGVPRHQNLFSYPLQYFLYLISLILYTSLTPFVSSLSAFISIPITPRLVLPETLVSIAKGPKKDYLHAFKGVRLSVSSHHHHPSATVNPVLDPDSRDIRDSQETTGIPLYLETVHHKPVPLELYSLLEKLVGQSTFLALLGPSISRPRHTRLRAHSFLATAAILTLEVPDRVRQMAFGCKLPSPVFGISPEACFVVSRAFVYFISRLSSIPNLTFLLFFSSSPYFSLSLSLLSSLSLSLVYSCTLVDLCTFSCRSL